MLTVKQSMDICMAGMLASIDYARECRRMAWQQPEFRAAHLKNSQSLMRDARHWRRALAYLQRRKHESI